MDKNEIASVAYRYVGSGGLTKIRAQTLSCAVQDGPSTAVDLVVNESCCLLSYRRWKLGDDIDLIVRCEHDGVMTGANGEVSFINIKTLNEWDSRVRHHYSCVPAVCSGVGSWVLTQPLWVQGYLKFPSLPTE